MLDSNQVYNDYIDDDFELQDANNQMNENDDFIFESVETIESCEMVENINEIEIEDNLEEMNEEEEMIVQNIENDIENVIPSNQLTTTIIKRNLHLDLLKSSKKTPSSINYRMPLQIIKLASSQAQSTTQSPAESPAQSSTESPAQSYTRSPAQSSAPLQSSAQQKTKGQKGRPKGSKNKPKTAKNPITG